MDYQKFCEAEICGLFGEKLLQDLNEIIGYYDFYDGNENEAFNLHSNLDYDKTVKSTNLIKKIVDEQARFLFGKTPEISLFSETDKDLKSLKNYLDNCLEKNNFSQKLLKACKDCFIGKRVALKLHINDCSEVVFSFLPSISFVFDVDSYGEMNKVIFFHMENDEMDKSKQRIWKQKFEMKDGYCVVFEGVYDGYGSLLNLLSDNTNTGLTFIPVKIILNDGLTGDLLGESDVAPLTTMQNVYNCLTSDDVDALKFNMFPQTVVLDASSDSIEHMVIAPGALVDLQTEITASDNKQAKISKLESSFSYDSRLENTLNRLKHEMFEMLNVPLVSTSELKGFLASGKSMKAIYWQLITRCEEKFVSWKTSIVWLCKAILEIGQLFNDYTLPDDLKIVVENIYPLPEDEYEEKIVDLQLVQGGVMSQKSFIEKWNRGRDSDFYENELKQIQKEKSAIF